MFTSIISLLKGKKVYICSVVIAITTFARSMSWISEEAFQAMIGVFSAGAVASMRSAVSDLPKK